MAAAGLDAAAIAALVRNAAVASAAAWAAVVLATRFRMLVLLLEGCFGLRRYAGPCMYDVLSLDLLLCWVGLGPCTRSIPTRLCVMAVVHSSIQRSAGAAHLLKATAMMSSGYLDTLDIILEASTINIPKNCSGATDTLLHTEEAPAAAARKERECKREKTVRARALRQLEPKWLEPKRLHV